MNELDRAEQLLKERLRWRVLKTAWAANSPGVRENLLLQVVTDLAFRVTREQLRSAITYLEGKALVTVRHGSVDWSIIISPIGTDVVEGNCDCPPGIAYES